MLKISIFSRDRSRSSSFEELVEPHVERMYRLGYHYTQNRADAEDLVQDLLVKLYPRFDEMKKIEQLGPWLAKILFRIFVDQYRRDVRNPVESGYDESIDKYEAATRTDLSTQRLETIMDLQSLIDKLSEEQRILLLMHDVESYTLLELSTIFDTPIGTLKSRLHRTRAKLRAQFKKNGTL